MATAGAVVDPPTSKPHHPDLTFKFPKISFGKKKPAFGLPGLSSGPFFIMINQKTQYTVILVHLPSSRSPRLPL